MWRKCVNMDSLHGVVWKDFPCPDLIYYLLSQKLMQVVFPRAYAELSSWHTMHTAQAPQLLAAATDILDRALSRHPEVHPYATWAISSRVKALDSTFRKVAGSAHSIGYTMNPFLKFCS